MQEMGNQKLLCFKCVLVIFCIIFSAILLDVFRLTYEKAFILSYVYDIVFILLFLIHKPFRNSTPAIFIILYSFVQSVGIALANLLNPEYTAFRMLRENYFYGAYEDKYISLSLLALSIMLLMMLSKQNKESTKTTYVVQPPNRVFYILGLLLLCLFTLYITFKAITGAIPFGNYELYKEIVSHDSLQNYLQKGYFMCSVFICSAGSKKQILLAFLLFLLPSGILLAAGNRNDILFPFLIGIGIYSVRFNKTPKLLITSLALFVFVVSPFLVSYRTGNIENSESLKDNFTEKMGESFFELGGQLAPVSSTFYWLENGEDYALGQTYSYSIYALIGGTINSNIRYQYENSPYCIGSRLPGFGYAMSAEVYYNWGIIGIILIYLFLGKFISRYEVQRHNLSSTQDYLKYGFLMLWILILVRNAFAYSFIDAIIFFIIYSLGCYIDNKIKFYE